MEINGKKDGAVIQFSVKGRLDAQTAPEAEALMRGWLSQGETKLVGDLSQLDYISSAGLRVLLMVTKNLKSSGGKLCLFALKPAVREVFDLAGFSSIIPIVPNKAEAVTKVGG